MADNYINESNFRDVFEAYFDPLCRFLNLYTKDADIIEDTIQEVFCNLWSNRDILQIKHIKSYLYTSSRNRMLNHIRDEKLHSSILAKYITEEQELQNAYDCVDKEEFAQKLEKAIEDLPAKCKNVFKLSRYSKLTYRQIADKEGISEKMVEKHVSSALKKIKATMGKMPILF